MFPIMTKIAGVTFGNRQHHIKLLGNSGINTFDLKREPMNPYDPNAVWVGFGKYQMGYLPKQVAREIAPLMDAGRRFEAEYVSLNGCSYNDTVGLTVKIFEV